VALAALAGCSSDTVAGWGGSGPTSATGTPGGTASGTSTGATSTGSGAGGTGTATTVGGAGGGGGLPSTPLPDFSLQDVNATSPTAGTQVSPRDYLEQVSGWFFGEAG
jgi:hypothetical protein